MPQQQNNSPSHQPSNDPKNSNQPVEFPELPNDDKKGQVVQPQGDIEKDLDPSESQKSSEQKQYKNSEPGEIIQ